jgi:arginyl-tRNA synthetase
MKVIIDAVSAVCKELYDVQVDVVLTRPDEQFGDYATNVALQLSKQLGKNPREIAEAIAVKTRENLGGVVANVTVAGPGFINITLTDKILLSGVRGDISQLGTYKKVLLEYSCPNAFKELHTGHLYQTIVGDSIGRILEATGSTVFRANFGGDVGLHVAKCLYGIVRQIGEDVSRLANVPESGRPEWVSAAYVLGAKAYEEDETAKAKMTEINSQIYGFHANNDHESALAQIYWQCRDWSYDYFKTFYDSIKVEAFDKYYPESTTIEPGMELVKQHTGSVFKESDGAVVYEGEDAGLHTRVFITSKGLPTYETKDLGVINNETKDFSYDKRIIITGNDQSEYMKVVFAALNALNPDLAAKQTHFTNGTVRFGSGQKMSSRLGNVTRAVDVIQTVTETVATENPASSDHYSTALAAIKYSFLKHRLGGDIAFDIKESVSLEGNSGPYLQYAHARARSILAKADVSTVELSELEPGERTLVRKLTEYNDVVGRAASEFMPHHICSFLYELAQTFNRFYEQNRVIGDPRQAERLTLVAMYTDILKNGLGLLGLHAPEHM